MTKKLKADVQDEDKVQGVSDRVWLHLERKYRLAKYESMSISIGASSSVDPGEDLKSASKRVFRQLREEFSDVVEVMREQEEI